MTTLKYMLGYGLMFLSLAICQAQNLMNYESRALLDRKQEYYLQMAQREASTTNLVVSSVNFELLHSAAFMFNLPNGQSFEIIKIEEDEIDSKRQFYYGEVSGSKGEAHFIRKAGMLTGHIQINGRIFNIRPLGEEKHVMIEVDQTNFESCGNNEHIRRLSGEGTVSKEAIKRQMPREWQNEGKVSESRSVGDCRIRVLVAYTKAVGSALVDPLSTVNLAIALTNTAYVNSGINQRIELARAFEVDYTEHHDQTTNLLRFTDNVDGFMDHVHTERERWRADMCHLLTNNGSGVAWINSSFRNVFAVTNYTYINNYVFGHEIGHNHLAQHDPSIYNNSSNYRGYGHPEGYFGTLMASALSACGGRGCRRVNEFSGPNNLYYHAGTETWYPTGNPTQNNVAAHNTEGPKIANHYQNYTDAGYTSTIVNKDEAVHAAAAITIQNSRALPNFIYQNGSEGSFKASQRVTLGPGFRAKSGSSFRAYLENCAPLLPTPDSTVEQLEEKLSYSSHSSDTLATNTDYKLSVYPNPSKGTATIEYRLPQSSIGNIRVLNMQGQEVFKRSAESQVSGLYKHAFAARDLPNGIYMIVLDTNKGRETVKLVLQR